jgi:hypothetical protein
MKPYALDKRHPTAKASTKLVCRRSSAYMTIMNVSAITPKTVMAGLFTATSDKSDSKPDKYTRTLNVRTYSPFV